MICHKNLCRYIYTDTGQLPREGAYGIGDSFSEQGEGFDSAGWQPLIDLFTAAPEEAIYYLYFLYFNPAAFRIEWTDVLPIPT